MTRNLKALGLALLAVFAMSAVAASGASAAEDVFTSSEEVTDLTGHGEGAVFRTTPAGAPITCETETYNATIEGEAVPEFTLGAEYHDCSAFGGAFNATVDMNSCGYTVSGETHDGDATVEVECDTPGDSITITTACTIHIPEQVADGGIAFHNGEENGKKDVTGTITADGIHSTVTHGFGCTLAGISPATHTNGTYEGEATITGYEHESAHEAADQVDISVDTR